MKIKQSNILGKVCKTISKSFIKLLFKEEIVFRKNEYKSDILENINSLIMKVEEENNNGKEII
jgi:hypothetical protein